MAAEKQESARKRAINQGLEAEGQIQKKANLRTNDFVQDNFDPTNRAANYETQAANQEKSFGELLAKQSSLGQGEINDSTAGALSDEYVRGKAKATADTQQRTRDLSRLLSRQGAVGGLANQDAMAGGDYSSDMMGFGVDQRLNNNLTNVKFGSAGSKGGELSLLGGLLSGSAGVVGGAKRKYDSTRTPGATNGTDWGE